MRVNCPMETQLLVTQQPILCGEMADSKYQRMFNYSRRVFINVFVLLCFIEKVTGGDTADRTRLHKSLLSEPYDKNVYPGSENVPLQVDIHFSMTAFNDFDEKAGRFAIAGFLTANWTDNRMLWSPGDFGDISTTQVPQNLVWYPTIVIWNSHGIVRPFGFDSVPVRYTHSGEATWKPGNLFETSCDAQIRTFPFDVQKCTIDILPYGYLPDEIQFNAAGIDESDYETNGMWKVLSMNMIEVRNETKGEKIMVEMQFKRRSSYHVMHTILPMIAMSILNILVFIIPIDGSNRIDYAMTMLLTLSVFLTIVSDTLPESSLPEISYLSVVVLVHMLSSSMMLVCTIVSFRLNKQNTGTFRRLMGLLNPGAANKRSTKKNSQTSDSEKLDISSEESPTQAEDVQVMQVSKTFDYLCIVFFSVLVIVVNLFFFIAANLPFGN